MEIERKFLLDRFPEELPLLGRHRAEQSYIATDPVVRIRSMEGAQRPYVLCFKGKGTLAREEIELSISEEVYTRLLALVPAPPIVKDYRVYELPGGLRLECSLVDGEFLYAEVEFETVEAAQAFCPPAFLGREVTQEPYYSMSRYWARKVAALGEKREE